MASVSSSWTASAMVEKVEAGALCKGIYLTDDIEELLTEREAVIKVKDNLDFKGAKSIQETHQRIFTSQRELEIFENNIDKCSSTDVFSKSATIWGMSILDGPTETDFKVEETPTTSDDGYVAALTYELVPVAAVNLTTTDLELRPEVIIALQEIEKSLKPLYKTKGQFQQFFEKFGSHFNHGVVEFGGILLSTASCRDFSEAEIEGKMSHVLQFSKVALREIFVTGRLLRWSSTLDASLATKKIGGWPDTESRSIWKKSLMEASLCRIINRSSLPKPIWELIQNHKDKFEKPLVLANAMKEEWENHKNPEMQVRYQRLGVLRSVMERWLELCNDKDEKNVASYMKNLATFRQKLTVSEEDWQEEVLYSAEVQDILTWSAQCMKRTNDPLEKQQLPTWIRKIMDPVDKIQVQHFPKIHEIASYLDELRGLQIQEPFEMMTISDLPNILQERIEEIWPSEELRRIQECLEYTIKCWSKKDDAKYQYLLCMAVLQQLNFNPISFRFEYALLKEDLQGIIETLKEHFFQFNSIQSVAKKQAYLLYVAMEHKHDSHNALNEMLRAIEGEISPEINEILRESTGEDHALNQAKFQKDIGLLLEGNVVNIDLKALTESLKCQLTFMEDPEVYSASHFPDEPKAGKSLETILDALEMKKFYPQKLTYDEVITLTSDAENDTEKTPTSVAELPWYFLRQIVAVDSSTRENSHITNSPEDESSDSEDSSSDDSSSSSSEDEVEIASVHILDLIYVIFLCADDFLRQELVDKMAKCQYAVPFILPFPDDSDENQRNLLLYWGLKSLSRPFFDKDGVVHRTLVDMEAPIISCLSFGEETSWKSRILNTMLCPQQETFWHQVLKGGDSVQRLSQGMVEAAWYLPGDHKDDLFSSPVTFLNCRGNSAKSPCVRDVLVNSSTVSCIFVEEISEDLMAFLTARPSLKRLVLVILHRKENAALVKTKCKELRKTLNLEKCQIIQKSADDANFHSVCAKLKKSMGQIIQQSLVWSLATVTNQARGQAEIKIDDEQCRLGHEAAQEILNNIDEINKKKALSAKREVLPCHSDLNVRREISTLEKELCRQRKRTEHTTLQNYAHDIKARKLRLELYQLQRPISKTFRYFILCLISLSRVDRKYFLQSLKLGLNERSMKMLQPLYQEYERSRLEVESKEKREKLKLIDEQITYGSLGLEHFFREMAVLYENMAALKEKSNSEKGILDRILEKICSVMAEAFMEGTALEIMDGDTVQVPISWLKAVLNKVENSGNTRLFKVSVLGAQSCGKSTLLNTAFGLSFPVSSGRCTRGAYMQLVKVEEKMRETLKSDYVLVIDSEGLMSRLRPCSSDYDNELATFVIGLSDLTLVIIKGEGNEMQDVLPLAIHVFLRMNIVGEHQSCHFVHQNMGAVGDMQTVAIEIDAFVQDLNDKTLAAAIDVDQSDHYSKFTDVLQYDETRDNTYVPGLWDGSLPMAKTKTHYSHTVQQLKSDILHHIGQLTEKKMFGTFMDFTKRLHELWEAIKYENFLFSFQNVLAVEAYTQLSKVYKDVQWKVKRDVREMTKGEQHRIENHLRQLDSVSALGDMIHDSKFNVTKHILTAVGNVEQTILHYFQCSGCDTCNGEVKHRHLLTKYEKEFKDEIWSLQKTLIKELENQMENLEIKLKADDRIHQLSAKMDHILIDKVHEAIQRRKDNGRDEETFEHVFAQFWRDATGDISRMAFFAEERADIKASIQATITKLLDKDGQFYVRKIEEVDTTRRHRNRRGKKHERFIINDKKHLKLKGFVNKSLEFMNLVDNAQDVRRLEDYSHRIIALTKKYYDERTSPSGKRFDYKDGEMLFNDVLKQIDAIDDKRFKTTTEYKIDLLMYIEAPAVQAFTEMHAKYCKESSPEALLEKKKKIYHDIFMVKTEKANAAAKFCENVFTDMILKNIEDQLSCTELLHELRVHCGETFRDIKSLQASIMVDLYQLNTSQGYIDYISNYEIVVKKKIWQESLKYFQNSCKLKNLALIKLDQIIETLQESVDKTCSDRSSEGNFIKIFFSNLENLKTSHLDFAAFMDLYVPDKRQFGAIVYQELQGPIRRDITKTINAWNVEQKMLEKDMIEFLFSEVVGCSARCPFCGVPCDTHSGGKTTGNHASMLHRPKGLGGVRNIRTEKLVVDDCRMGVASPTLSFHHGFLDEFITLYREYSTVYPNWTIHGDADPDREKYWKWVFAQHNHAFAEYYSAKDAIIPLNWAKYSKKEIRRDIEDHYHVKVKVPMSDHGSARPRSIKSRLQRIIFN